MYYTIKTAKQLKKQLKKQNKSAVLVTGFFDLLHQEHKNFLKKAAKEEDVLVVAVESDKRAKLLKGDNRPKQTQKTRAKNLLSLPFVNYCILLPDNFSKPFVRKQLIKNLSPQTLAISSHTPHQKQKQETIKKYGGKLKIVHDHNPKISTTKIIKNT